MSVLQAEIPHVFAPLMQRMRYLGAWGGRASGKSHFFATKLIIRAIEQPGLRAVCVREVQKSLAQSVKQLIEDKIKALGVEEKFEVLESEIRTPGGGLIVFQGMSNHNASTIKSLEGMDIAWVEEAQALSQRSLDLLRPTIRSPDSEIWFSWNPENENDPVDRFLRGHSRPPNAIVIQANYTDNPFCSPAILEEAELDRRDPDKWAHIWAGEYAKIVEGAYYTDLLRAADTEGRICPLAVDPILGIKASWDIGIADATAIWVAQWVGAEIRFIDYIEGTGQPLAYYLNELRSRGYERAECILPHDGATRSVVTALRFEDHIRQAGFAVEVIHNQGRGAAMQRIESMRRWFPRMYFDGEKTLAGRKALAAYHENIDERRQIGLGPLHDWSSHAADAAGLMALAYREPSTAIPLMRAADRSFKWVV